MEARYYCRRGRRQQAVRDHATLNGIEFLEVLDREAPAGSPRQQTLFVQLLKVLDPAVDFSARNVAIRGGVRVRDIDVLWAARASDAPDLFNDGLISAAERDLFLDRDAPAPGDLLVVRTESTGDFSTYTLTLVDDDAPLATLDPPLAEVGFSFKVECPSEFDCAPAVECETASGPQPVIDYLARDYASFRRLMLDRLSVVMPAWRERSPADLGIALVEVLAYAADRLSYYQDAVATESYLDTARRRTSVRRHARLLDYPMHDGVNARAWVCFQAAAGVTNVLLAPEYLPGSRTRLLTRVAGYPALLNEDLFAEMVAEHAPRVFELLHDVRVFAAHNEIRLWSWGDEQCCLPRGCTRATLRDDAAARLLLRPGDVLILEEVLGASTGAAADADPAHRHAVRLTQVSPGAVLADDGTRSAGPLAVDELFAQPIVEIEWAPEDALPFPLCVSALVADEDGQERLVEDVSIARGNVALVDHGRTMPPERLPPPAATRRYRPRLREAGVTQAVPYDPALPPPSAAAALRQDPRAALPAVTLREGNGEIWRRERDLLASDAFDPDFVGETESDGTTALRFGDDLFARRPEPGLLLEATYRVGGGTGGNAGADAISHLLTTPGLGVEGVRNPLPAVGGTAPETLEEVREYAPEAFRRQERAVTEADYAQVAQRHPEVSRAVARRRWTGSWHTIFVTIDRVAARPVDDPFEAEMAGWIDRYRLAGHDVEIEAPRFVSLDVALTICVKPGYFRSDVKERLLKSFGAFFHPDAFTFGQHVYLSQIVARAMEVPGVRWVEVDPESDPPGRFQRWGELPRGEIAEGRIAIGRLEIARLDNDPGRPENGRLVFHMLGGS